MCKWCRRRSALAANEVLRFEFGILLICHSKILTQKDIFPSIPPERRDERKHKYRNKLSQRLSNGACVSAVCHQLYIRASLGSPTSLNRHFFDFTKWHAFWAVSVPFVICLRPKKHSVVGLKWHPCEKWLDLWQQIAWKCASFQFGCVRAPSDKRQQHVKSRPIFWVDKTHPTETSWY